MPPAGVFMVVLSLFSLVGAQEPMASKPRPNIVLVLADDLGWSDIGCYGNSAIDTPHLDAFARQGVRFTDAYAAAPVCSPTRASIMTGHAPARLRITNHLPDQKRFLPDQPKLIPPPCPDRLPLAATTVAELLSTARYRCAFMGKWHLSPLRQKDEPAFRPEHQGFEINIGGNGQGGPGRSFFAPYRFPGLVSRDDGEYLPYRLGAEAVKFIIDHDTKGGGRPFFLSLWNYAVHWPMDAPADLLAKYTRMGRRRGIKDVRYAAMVEALDTVFGQLMRALEESGHARNTLVIFASDNGGLISVADCRPLRMGKGYLYEAGIRVPTMMRWPGRIKAGVTEKTPVISTDFFATILTAAGIPLPKDHPGDGESLVPLVTRRQPLKRDALYFHYPHHAWHRSNRLGGAMRQGRYKIIERFDDSSVELYDLENDLSESTDIANRDPQSRARARRMRDRLVKWRVEVGAAMPTKPD